MVFNAFCVNGGSDLVDSDCKKEAVHDRVAFATSGCKTLAFGGQGDRLIRGGRKQTLVRKPPDNPIDCHMADCKSLGKSRDTTRFVRIQDVRDRFDIVFRRFRCVIAPSPLMWPGFAGSYCHGTLFIAKSFEYYQRKSYGIDNAVANATISNPECSHGYISFLTANYNPKLPGVSP